MTNHSQGDYKPCRRCGRTMAWSNTAKVPGICMDCRLADPEYVAMITQQIERDHAARARRRTIRLKVPA